MLKRNCDQVVRLLLGKKICKRGELTRLYHLLNGFVKKQLEKTYQDFNGIITLGQFVTLGVVLVGILARVYGIYKNLLEMYESEFIDAGFIRVPSEKPNETKEFMESLVEEELGEAVSSEAVSSDISAPKIVRPADDNGSKKKDSKKKKKKKSAIDSIFG